MSAMRYCPRVKTWHRTICVSLLHLYLIQRVSGLDAEDVSQLLAKDAALYGPTRKHGMLPLDKWYIEFGSTEDRSALFEWSFQHALGNNDGTDGQLPLGHQPPSSGLCTLLINPAYKFIFVKNTKVAGSSVFKALGAGCGGNATIEDLEARPSCLWQVAEMAHAGSEAFGYGSWDELWKDFTVFTAARNPYTRAASSYGYVYGRHARRQGPCAPISFQHFSRRPYAVGLQDLLFNCGDAIHDFYHVEPQFKCLLDATGKLVTDFIVRVEHLEEDFRHVIDVVNSKRRKGLPALEAKLGWEQKGPETRQKQAEQTDPPHGSPAHVESYMQCGQACMNAVSEYYRKDFELFQYPVQ